MLTLSRRRMLSITANVMAYGAIARAAFPGLAMAQEITVRDYLARMARDLFPHDDLPDSVYLDIAGMIVASETGSTGDLEMITTGIAELDKQAGGDWYGRDDRTRLTALEAIASSEFFNNVRGRINAALYLRPETWDLLGYGGSAFEKGGYLNRGFDDIDWL